MIESYITGHNILKDIVCCKEEGAVAAYGLIAHARKIHLRDSSVDELTVFYSKIRLLTSLLLSINQNITQVALIVVCTTNIFIALLSP